MSEYIEREEALNELENIHDISASLPDGPVRKTALLAVETIKRSLSDIPAADVREVVLCRDCIQFVTGVGFCRLTDWSTKENDFCSFGERKDGANMEGGDGNG